nr:hypothetical protein [Tanacetum cinerariifolium]
MADMNIPANDTPTEQAHAIVPPTRTDDQNFPSSKWVPIGKSNCFWDTMCFNSSTGLYSCQLDEQWLNLHKDFLRDALDITPTNDNYPYAKTPCASYSLRKNLATTSRGKKKITHLLILNVRFTKLIIHHLKTKHNIHLRIGSPLHYSYDENILNTLMFVRKDGREIFGMPIPHALLIDEIKGPSYYDEYQEHVAKYQQYLDAEHGKAEEGGATESLKTTKGTKTKVAKATKPTSDKASMLTSTQPPKPKPAPTQLSKLVDEPSVEDVPIEEPAYNKEEANLQRALELSLKEQTEQTQGPARPVVIKEPNSGRIQPLPDVQGNGKENVINEQAAHDLLTLLNLKNKSHRRQGSSGACRFFMNNWIFRWQFEVLLNIWHEPHDLIEVEILQHYHVSILDAMLSDSISLSVRVNSASKEGDSIQKGEKIVSSLFINDILFSISLYIWKRLNSSRVRNTTARGDSMMLDSSRKHPFVRTRKMIGMTLQKEQIQVFKVTGIQVLEIFFSSRVFLEISSSKDNFAQVVIPVSRVGFNFDDTENPHG